MDEANHKDPHLAFSIPRPGRAPAVGRGQTDRTQGANPTLVRAATSTSSWAPLNSRSRRPTRRGGTGKCTRRRQADHPSDATKESDNDRIAADLEPPARETPSRQVESLPIRSTFELPPVYLRTVSRTLELSLQSSLQLSLTVLVCYRSRGKYLALGGVYHPLWAALSSNPTPRKGPNAPRS